MGLTNSVVMPAMLDDPHGAFDQNDVAVVPPQMKKIFDAFMTDLTNNADDNTMQSLADDTVITIHGDTPKDCLNRSGWPDGTANNTNLVYIYSAGHLKSGWFAGIDRNGNTKGVGPDGKETTYNGGNAAKLATASIAYAIAKRDERAISQFANGIQISNIFGVPKVV